MRVLIVDDDALFRQQVRFALAEDPRFEVAGEGADGAEAVELARRLEPDVVLMDLRMPVKNGLQATRELRQQRPAIDIVIVSAVPGVDPARVGAIGLIEKPNFTADSLAEKLGLNHH